MSKRVVGPVSWFGGPNDGMDSGKTAGGQTTATPGVAIRPGAHYESGRATLGGYWRITDPKTGKSVVLKQTDIGPNQSTGRRIDVTYSALRKFGYSERNFPTDANWQAEYLGKNPGTSSPSARTPTRSQNAPAGGSDLQAQARRQAAAQWLLSSSKSTADLENRVAQAEASVPASSAQPKTVTQKGKTTVRPKGGSTAKEQGLSPLLEMFYDPQGGFDNPSHGWDGVTKIPPIGGHSDHVHVAAGPKTLARLDKRAAKFGLRVSSADRPGAVTASGNKSFHSVGKARDYAGSPAEMAAWARYLRRIYKTG